MYSSSLLTLRNCDVMSSPAKRRIAAAKSKILEARRVVCRASLRPADRPPGIGGKAAGAAKRQRASALLRSARLTLGVMTFTSVFPNMAGIVSGSGSYVKNFVRHKRIYCVIGYDCF